MKRKITAIVILSVIAFTGNMTPTNSLKVFAHDEQPSWREAYVEVVRDILTRSDFQAIVDGFSRQQFFYLFDIDRDGVPELLIIRQCSECVVDGLGGATLYSACPQSIIYTFRNGSAIALNGGGLCDVLAASGTHLSAPPNNNPGIISTYGHLGGGWGFLWNIEGNRLAINARYVFRDNRDYCNEYYLNGAESTWEEIRSVFWEGEEIAFHQNILNEPNALRIIFAGSDRTMPRHPVNVDIPTTPVPTLRDALIAYRDFIASPWETWEMVENRELTDGIPRLFYHERAQPQNARIPWERRPAGIFDFDGDGVPELLYDFGHGGGSITHTIAVIGYADGLTVLGRFEDEERNELYHDSVGNVASDGRYFQEVLVAVCVEGELYLAYHSGGAIERIVEGDNVPITRSYYALRNGVWVSALEMSAIGRWQEQGWNYIAGSLYVNATSVTESEFVNAPASHLSIVEYVQIADRYFDNFGKPVRAMGTFPSVIAEIESILGTLPLVEGNDSVAITPLPIGIKITLPQPGNPHGYNIYRATNRNGRGERINNRPITGGAFVDVNVNSHGTYFYTVYETDALGQSVARVGAGQTEVTTGDIPHMPGARHDFIILNIGSDSMIAGENVVAIDPGRGTAPIIQDGRTLLPIRAVVEAMSGTVGWEASERRVSIAALGNNLDMWIDRTDIRINDVQATMDIAPAIINERTMVPVRFVAENIGAQIEWVGDTQSVVIVFLANS